MSRSYRKSWVTDGYTGSKRKQFFKRLANKVVRRSEEVPNGKAFKKFFDTWSICDYRYYADVTESWCDNPCYYNRK